MGKTLKNLDDGKKVIREAGLYLVEKRDYDKVLDIMSDFYSSDSLLHWICDGKHVKKVGSSLYRACLNAMTSALIYADSPDMNAVAVWAPPGFSVLNPGQFMKNGGWELYKIGGLHLFYKLLKYDFYVTRIHRRQTAGKDWFLFLYGVKDTDNIMTFGEKMFLPMTRYCWDKGLACYSEVNSDKAIMFLKQAGFQVREQGKIPGSNVNHYGVLI